MCAVLLEQLLNHPLGLVVLALSKVVISNASLAIDEIVRRPVFIVEGSPDRVVAIDRNGVDDLQIANRFFHIGALFFEGEFRRMHANNDQTRVFILRCPSLHVR